MIEEAINYPRSGDDALTTILIGGVLGLLAVLVVPIFLLFGFTVRVLRSVEAGEETPPTFGEWGDLLVDGVKAFAIVLVYSIVPLVVLGVTAGGVAVAALTGDVRPGAIAGAFLGVSVAGILWLVAFYVIPAALASFASEGRMGAAFDTTVLRGVLLDSGYATAWLVALVIFVVAGIVVGVLNAVPPVGFVVGAFVNFYVGVAAAYLYGHAFVDASAGDVPPETGAQPAV
jgi:hypothetical protein